jgi:hypothetical protein
MRWRKLGLVFSAREQSEWMVSHAANPVAERRGGDEFRVYFGCRDRRNRSHVAYVDLELADAVRVLRVSREPVLSPGPPGTFDDSGTSMGCLVTTGSRRYLFFLGWNLGVSVPWRNSIGVAVSEGPGKAFIRCSPGPIMDRCTVDPYTLTYPCVLREGRTWKMWYGSCTGWGPDDADLRHVIKYAESDDGISWRRDGTVALELSGSEENTVIRPWVVKEGQLFRMWFCHRGKSYRLGYAESTDGIHWVRQDEKVGLEISPEGWDAEMMAYPCTFEHRGRYYLLYNGNAYGRAGFGVAVAG